MRLKASYTIEHAYIVPFVIINIMIILTLSLLMHDMLILKSTAVITAQKLEKESSQTGEIVNNSLLYLNNRIVLLKNIKLDIKEENNSIKVEIKGEFLFSYKELSRFAQVKQSGSIKDSNPTEFVRGAKAFKELIQKR